MESTAFSLPLEENLEFLKVSPYRVYINLKHLNQNKAPCPDGLSNWLLKEYAELLARSVSDVLNYYTWNKSYLLLKLADITPLQKVKQVSDPKKELRPISLPSALS